MEYQDYYKALEVDKTAGLDELKKAFRKLARKYHPDINPHDKVAEQRFKEINEANEVLTDSEKRAKYDRLSVSWQLHQQAGDKDDFDWSEWVSNAHRNAGRVNLDDILQETNRTSNFSDFFEAIFGGTGSPRSTLQQGQDYTQKVEISLEEAFNGASRILRIGERRIEVKIPRGAKSGTKVRVRGEGAEGLEGGSKGDLYLDIVVTPHPAFERVGDDLYTELPVDLYSAILGGEAAVPTLKGKIKLRIPPETQSGRTFRLKGQGMPVLKQPDERGDLYAKVVVQLPQNLTPEEIALFEELADMRGL
jgi:curved DNA-binding protein